jgi:hypothetical protein
MRIRDRWISGHVPPTISVLLTRRFHAIIVYVRLPDLRERPWLYTPQSAQPGPIRSAGSSRLRAPASTGWDRPGGRTRPDLAYRCDVSVSASPMCVTWPACTSVRWPGQGQPASGFLALADGPAISFLEPAQILRDRLGLLVNC